MERLQDIGYTEKEHTNDNLILISSDKDTRIFMNRFSRDITIIRENSHISMSWEELKLLMGSLNQFEQEIKKEFNY